MAWIGTNFILKVIENCLDDIFKKWRRKKLISLSNERAKEKLIHSKEII